MEKIENREINLAYSRGKYYNKNFADRRRRLTDESISFN